MTDEDANGSAGSPDDAHREPREAAEAARRREVQALTPGERMERAFHLFQLTRDRGSKDPAEGHPDEPETGRG